MTAATPGLPRSPSLREHISEWAEAHAISESRGAVAAHLYKADVGDFHDSDVRKIKSEYGAGEVFNFVWQGLPGNLRYFFTIGDVIAI